MIHNSLSGINPPSFNFEAADLPQQFKTFKFTLRPTRHEHTAVQFKRRRRASQLYAIVDEAHGSSVIQQLDKPHRGAKEKS